MGLMDAGDRRLYKSIQNCNVWVDWTYTGNKMMRKTAMKMIKCSHHHFLKWAFRRAPKPRLAGGETVVDSNSVTPGLPDIVK